MPRRPAAHSGSGFPRGAARPGRGERLTELDLHSLDVAAGAACALELEVPIAPLSIGGQDYVAEPSAPPVQLEIVRLVNGWHLRLRTRLHVAGPCWRCLEDARPDVRIDATEVAIAGADDPEMTSLYLDDDVLAVADWARDAVAEALPTTILCTDECAGLCAMCGANLNEGACGCVAPASDSRWSALADLAARLEGQDGDGHEDTGVRIDP